LKNPCLNSFVVYPTCPDEVIGTGQGIVGKMSKGYDELSTEVLKKTLNFIAKPLADLINMSFSDGVSEKKTV